MRGVRYPWLAALLAVACLAAIAVPIIRTHLAGSSPAKAATSTPGADTLAPSSGESGSASMPTTASPETLAPLIPPDDPLASPSVIPLELRPRAVFLGDSITLGDSNFAAGYVGEMSWFYALVSAPDAPIAFAGGIADNGMLTSWMADHVWEALSMKPDMLIVIGGTNDVAAGVPTDETFANLQRIVDAADQAGVKVAFGTIPPSDQQGLDQKARDFDAALVPWVDSVGAVLLDTAAPLRGSEGLGWGEGLKQDGTD